MSRYFVELSYQGTAYSGFQVQANAHSVQAEVEKAFAVYLREPVSMTGSSRTDTGVHALSNYFHFDREGPVPVEAAYHINAILPGDISIRRIFGVADKAHCRYDARSRAYAYYIYREKNPFLRDRAYYFPYTLDFSQLEGAAAELLRHEDFTSFAKRNTQVSHFRCTVMESSWEVLGDRWVFRIRANRFLRGMVRGLAGTMLQVGRGRIGLGEFRAIIEAKDAKGVNFNVPGHGLFLEEVLFDAVLVNGEGVTGPENVD